MIAEPSWESVVATSTEATDRLAIPGGWLYRTVWHRASAGLGHPESQGSAVVFVPRSIFDLDHPYLAPEDSVITTPAPMVSPVLTAVRHKPPLAVVGVEWTEGPNNAA